MPEGHSIHRLAHALRELFLDQALQASSPQGRFAAGAALIDGQYLTQTQAWGKHLFMGFGPQPGAEPTHWLHIHLGIYGSWRFAGDESFQAPHSIGAPRRPLPGGGLEAELPHDPRDSKDAVRAAVPASSVQSSSRPANTTRGLNGLGSTKIRGASGAGDRTLEVHLAADSSTLVDHESFADRWAVGPVDENGRFQAPPPVGQVRLRLLSTHGVADLSGPNTCEIITGAEKAAIEARLGPDPLQPQADPAAFIAKVRSSSRPIGQLLMDQSVLAGVGNIYRAEVLFITGTPPRKAGRLVSKARLEAMWQWLVAQMPRGVESGRITTVRLEDVPTEVDPQDLEATRYYVYRRTGRPCLRCGTAVAGDKEAGRNLFWCPRCQAR